VAITTIAVGAVAVAGSSLTYFAYVRTRNTSSNIAKTIGSFGSYPGFQTTPTPAPATPLMTFNDHTKTIWAVSWSSNGKYIASASDDGTSHVWSATTHERLYSYRSQIQPAQSDDGAYSIAWTPDSSRIAVGFADGTAQLVDLTSHKQIGFFDSGTGGDLHGILYAVSLSPNGRYIASGSADATARVWDWNNGKSLLIYDKQGDTVRSVSWSPDDSRIVTANNNIVQVWQI
jgi:WD40 repeat protein